jgi:Uma2 family endonuclease
MNMLTRQKEMTLEEFIAFAHLPENEERNFELIDREVVEMSPSRARNSELGDVLSFEVRTFCKQHNLPCHTAGRDATFNILGNVIAPDFVYKPTEMSWDYPDPIAPLWAVEMISPSETAANIRDKREIYLRAGILYWEVYYPKRRVDVYAPDQPVKTYKMGDVLNGGNVLPGFTLEVAVLFA